MSENIISESSEGDRDNKCSICYEILDDIYATADHPSDAQTRCCVNCMKEWFKSNHVSLINRVPVESYTIYQKDGTVIEKIMLSDLVGEPDESVKPEVPEVLDVPHDHVEEYRNPIPIRYYDPALRRHNYPYPIPYPNPYHNPDPNPPIMININEPLDRYLENVPEYNQNNQNNQNNNNNNEPNWRRYHIINAVVCLSLAAIMFILYFVVRETGVVSYDASWAFLGLTFGFGILAMLIYTAIKLRKIRYDSEQRQNDFQRQMNRINLSV